MMSSFRRRVRAAVGRWTVPLAAAALSAGLSGCDVRIFGKGDVGNPRPRPLPRAYDVGLTSDDPVELATACDDGDVIACVNLAVKYDKGMGIAPDRARAAARHERACALGEPSSCSRAADLYADSGMPGDVDRAARLRALSIPLYEQHCAEDKGVACDALAYAYSRGDGVKKDVPRAIELRTRACAQDPTHCFSLGNMYYRGEDVPRDLEKAAELFTKACHGNHPAACFLLAEMTERRNDGRQRCAAMPLYAKACEGGLRLACDGRTRLEADELCEGS
jgi:TPR repeat protein